MPIVHQNSGWVDGERGGLSYRSWIAFSGWIIILATLLIWAVLSSDVQVITLLGLSLAYALQGCVAEFIGVKIEVSGISFPNRVFSRFPYLILFRRKLSTGSFDRIDFVNKRMLIIYPARDQIIIAPTKSRSKHNLVRVLREIFPMVSVKIM
jgi:hypothetical protein